MFFSFFPVIVNYATFVSNDKVNERIFQRELGLPEQFFFFFQRLDKLEQFGKRPQACRMIVSHANNHLLTLSEFAWDKANYHLKMSSKTLWAKHLHHDSQLYYCRYVTTHIYTQMLTNMYSLWTGCRDIIWMLWSDGRFAYCCIQLKLIFSQSDAATAFFFCLLMLWFVWRHLCNIIYVSFYYRNCEIKPSLT